MPAKHSSQRAEPGSPVPPNVFFATPAQRVGLARQRFFEEGVRPTGLVPDPVIQSWTRCLQSQRGPRERISFEPVTRSRISNALARNRLLLAAAHDDLGQLEATLSGTPCKAMLSDAQGVIVHATPTERHEGALICLASRVGVDVTEGCLGTTAPGVTMLTGQSCVVSGAEHFFDLTRVMYCAAAPIHDAHGGLVGVLDLSCEGQPFRFDAASVVRLYATAIENRLLAAQSAQHVLVRFQAARSLLNTPFEGLAAIDGRGVVAWINAAGASLLAAPRGQMRGVTAEEAFGLGLAQLLDAAHAGRVLMQRVPNGLGLCLLAQLPESRGAASVGGGQPAMRLDAPGSVVAVAQADAAPAVAPAAPADTTLHDASRHLIERTLAANGGNVSRTARELGVSRGLIYRHLRQAGAPSAG